MDLGSVRSWRRSASTARPDLDPEGSGAADQTVVIIEGRPRAARALADRLTAEGFTVAGTAATAREGIDLAQRTTPDQVLLDFDLPDMDGPTATAEIRSLVPDTQVVVLLTSVRRGDVLAALRAGASACASQAEDDDIVLVLRRIGLGEFLVSRGVVAMLLDAYARRAPANVEAERIAARLTAREREILSLMSEGLTTRGIAERLAVSVNTVRMHVQNLLRKTGAHSKLEAVTKARQLGLLDH